MSAENVALNLKDIILGISESLNQAQNLLINAPSDNESGLPEVLYTIPELNFSIEVEATFNSPDTPASTSQSRISRTAMRSPASLISFKPLPMATATPSSSGSSNRLTSNISGKFIATMPNAGLPQIEVFPVITELTNTRFEIAILVVNSIGEAIVNQKVEFNFNETLTTNLNAGQNITAPSFDDNVLNTGATGKVTNVVTIGANTYNYIIDINVGKIQKRISIQSVSQNNG